MSFSFLPPELLSMICGYCDVSELKSLRATNRLLATTIPRKELFSEVLLYMTRASLDYIQHVAQDKDISQTVQSLWVQGDIPELIRNFEVFEESWELVCEIKRTTDDVLKIDKQISVLGKEKKWLGTKEYKRRNAILQQRVDAAKAVVQVEEITKRGLRSYFRQYKKLREEAVQMQTNSSILKALRSVFQECSNLDSIHYTMENIIRKTTTRRNKHFAEGLVWPFGQSSVCATQGFEGVSQIVLAASEAGFSPRELRLGGVSDLVLSHQSLLDRFALFTRNLEILEWHFPWPEDPETGEIDEGESVKIIDRFRRGLFRRFVRNASMLRELTIKLPFCIERIYQGPLSISTLLGDITFTHLAKFCVHGMWTRSDKFYDFFMRHAGTLEGVFLADWSLEGTGWTGFFTTIAGKLKKLKQFELRGTFQDSFMVEQWFGHADFNDSPTKLGAAISRYVRGEIKDNPGWSSDYKDRSQKHESSTRTPPRQILSP